MNKGSKLYSVTHNKCPRCQEGDFFVSGSTYNPRQFHKMNKNCSVCGLDFEQEPGYYYGAMYVSYAINVAIMVAVYAAYLLIPSVDISIWWVVLLSMILGLVAAPVTFRWSRLIWINFFFRYRNNRVENLPGDNSLPAVQTRQ